MLLFRFSLNRYFFNIPYILCVVLITHYIRFERGKLFSFQHVSETAVRCTDFFIKTKDRGLIFGDTFGYLLVICIANMWLRLHNYARLGTFHASLPRTFMRVFFVNKVSCKFPKVPDISVVVLSKPVLGRFCQNSFCKQFIV